MAKQNQPAIITEADYSTWIRDIATRYRHSQILAAVRVNSELLHYYWSIGCDIHNRQFENRYGTAFYANASCDLRVELGVEEGLSESTLRYATRFYELYAPLFPNRQQPVADFFELRYEDQNKNQKFFYKWDGEGLRYEIQEFISCIINKRFSTARLRRRESVCMAEIMEAFSNRKNFFEI